VNWNSG